MGRSSQGGDPLPDDADVRCAACHGPLYFLPNSYPLAFHCDAGHFYTVRDLLREEPPAGSVAVAALLDYWRKKAQLLYQLAEHALKSGHPFVAADFQESAALILDWVSRRETLLRQHPHA